MGKYDHKPNPQLAGNSEFDQVAQWLAQVKFKKKALGGLDPEDVWKKLEELNALYENALVAERVRYNLMLRQIMAKRQKPEESDG